MKRLPPYFARTATTAALFRLHLSKQHFATQKDDVNGSPLPSASVQTRLCNTERRRQSMSVVQFPHHEDDIVDRTELVRKQPPHDHQLLDDLPC
jgi:hypothetical protein